MPVLPSHIRAIASTPAYNVWCVKFYACDANGRSTFAMEISIPCDNMEHAVETAKAYNKGAN